MTPPWGRRDRKPRSSQMDSAPNPALAHPTAHPMRRRQPSPGFTLLELLVVVAVIGLLAAFVGPRLFGNVSKSEITAAKAQIEAFLRALESYRLDTGKFPEAALGLQALIVKPADLKGALLRYLEYSGRLNSLRNKIVSALIYPAILFTRAVIVFLLAFVVPRFATVYRGARGANCLSCRDCCWAGARSLRPIPTSW